MELSFNKFVVNENETFRIDSEYFRKSLLEKTRLLKNLAPNILEAIAEIKGGKRLPLGEDFVDVGIPYIRAEDVKNSFVQHKNSPCISEKTYSQISSYQTKQDDVLLTIVGNSIGDVGIVKFRLKRCNLTENCVKIFPKRGALPEVSDYLFLFFMTSYGQAQIERERVGTAQPKLAIERIRRFMVPALSEDMQHLLAGLVASANEHLKESEQKYQQAEQTLLRALGLENWQPANQHDAIKKFSQSFAAAGRLDAEYYQPKYDEILGKLRLAKTAKLGDLVSIRKSIEPGSDAYGEEGLPFVRISDVSKHGITPPNIHISPRVVDNIEELKPKKDTILLSKDGSVGIAYKLEEDFDGITSGALLHLRVIDESVLPDYLTLVLNSIITQMQAERDAGGSIIQHWRPEQIREVVIPILPLKVQQTIAEKMQASFAARRQLHKLLELAKGAVERAIESSESEALTWLQVQLQQV